MLTDKAMDGRMAYQVFHRVCSCRCRCHTWKHTTETCLIFCWGEWTSWVSTEQTQTQITELWDSSQTGHSSDKRVKTMKGNVWCIQQTYPLIQASNIKTQHLSFSLSISFTLTLYFILILHTYLTHSAFRRRNWTQLLVVWIKAIAWFTINR